VGRVDFTSVIYPATSFNRSCRFFSGGFFSSFLVTESRRKLFLPPALTVSGKALGQSESFGVPSLVEKAQLVEIGKMPIRR
jgi:hypothetical protein